MYQFLHMCGNDFCLMNHESSELITVTKRELWQMVVEDGAEVSGLSREELGFAELKNLRASWMCDWADGKNVFGAAKSLHVTDDNKFVIKANNHNFGGVVNKDDEYVVMFCFDFGIQVSVMKEDYDVLMSGDVPKIVEMLKYLGNEPESYDGDGDSIPSLEEALEEAKDCGSEEDIRKVVRELTEYGAYPTNWFEPDWDEEEDEDSE